MIKNLQIVRIIKLKKSVGKKMGQIYDTNDSQKKI